MCSSCLLPCLRGETPPVLPAPGCPAAKMEFNNVDIDTYTYKPLDYGWRQLADSEDLFKFNVW